MLTLSSMRHSLVEDEKAPRRLGPKWTEPENCVIATCRLVPLTISSACLREMADLRKRMMVDLADCVE